MLKPYRTVQDVLSSPWAQVQRAKSSPQQTDRVLRSTKLEDSIYRDLRMEDTGMDEIENSAGEKLRSFPALSRDIFQSFYSLMPRRNADDDLSVAARKINVPILEHITQSDDYPTLKEVCEGRELPAYEAAAEFTAQTSGELDDLLSQLGGKPGAVQTLEKLEQAEKTAEDKLAALLEQLRGAPQDDPALSAAVVKAVRAVYPKTLIVKLSPNVTDITEIARAVEAEGADAVSLINTLLGMAIDSNRRRPVLSTITGGLSGACVKPIALRMVWQTYHAVKIPIVGLGGIMNATDAVEFILAGASAIEVGTANFIDPQITEKIANGIDEYLDRNNIASVKELIGGLICN